MRVLGVDPGLTRCGIGVIEGTARNSLSMIDVGVIRTNSDAPIDQRLLQLEAELTEWIKKSKPDVIAIERVFSQLNVRTAMATGQAAGVALLIAARSGIPVAMHTPSEVKAAVTGSGRLGGEGRAHRHARHHSDGSLARSSDSLSHPRVLGRHRQP